MPRFLDGKTPHPVTSNLGDRVADRGKTRATVENGHPVSTVTTRARVCVCVGQHHPGTLSYITTNPTPPLFSDRLTFLNGDAGLNPVTCPVTGWSR